MIELFKLCSSFWLCWIVQWVN